MKRAWASRKGIVLAAFVLACTAAIPVRAAAQPAAAALTRVTLQLQWVTQSQFAGYYAAMERGFYRDEGLDVTIKVGAVEIVPQ